MKILMINVVCGIRSTGRICTDLAEAYENAGHEVKIAYGRETVPEKYQKYAIRIGTDFSVKLHGIKARFIDGCGWGSKKETIRFIKWVKKFNPDIIHLHNIHGYYINVQTLFDYLKQNGKKVIWTFHDGWAFTGHSAYCDVVNCDRWKTQCFHCPARKIYPQSYFDNSKRNWEKKKEIFSNIPDMKIVTPSAWLAERVKQSFLSKYPVEVIHNGIDTKLFRRMEKNFKEKYGIKDKFLILGVATSWDDMKGIADYLKLSERLGEKYKVLLVGLTKKQIEKLPNNILGIERTDSIQELASIYSSADLFLNLSYCENYPTVDLEAIACGTKVITYDVGGGPEIVNAYGGKVVPKGDILAVIKAIYEYDSEENKYGLVYDKTGIDKKSCIDAYLNIIESMKT